MNAEQVTAWKCTKCGTYYTTKTVAESCCKESPKKVKVCEDCGVELDPKWYYTVCDSCREKRRYNRCRKMTIEEYENEFSDCMVVVGDDNYYSSVEDALEIARKTGAAKTAADKASADKLAQVAAEVEKTRLAQIEADQKVALERTAADAKAQQDALAKRDEAEQIAALQKAAASVEKLPDVEYPVADKLPPVTPQGVAIPLPPKDMMAVSMPLKTKTGGVVPWRIFVLE